MSNAVTLPQLPLSSTEGIDQVGDEYDLDADEVHVNGLLQQFLPTTTTNTTAAQVPTPVPAIQAVEGEDAALDHEDDEDEAEGSDHTVEAGT